MRRFVFATILLVLIFESLGCTADKKANENEQEKELTVTKEATPTPKISGEDMPIYESSVRMLNSELAIKTLEYFPYGSPIEITVGVGDRYSTNSGYIFEPTFETYGKNGGPLLTVMEIEWDTDSFKSLATRPDLAKKDGPLLINGERGYYSKKFDLNDMHRMDITKKYGEKIRLDDLYKQEIIINTDEIQKGDTGILIIEFCWAYDVPLRHEYDEEVPDEENPAIQYLFINAEIRYLAGEKGIVLNLETGEISDKNLEKYEGDNVKSEIDSLSGILHR